MDLAQRLRAAIAPEHDRIEGLPYAQALAGGRIDRDRYVLGLRQLQALHEALEEGLARSPDLGDVYDPGQARAGSTRSDLLALGEAPDAGPTPLPETRELVGRIDQWRGERPWALAGAWYIVEGSRLGSAMLAPALSRALGVPPKAGNGLDYHLGTGGRPGSWPGFRARLDAAAKAAGTSDDVVEGALAMMRGMAAIYEALGPAGPLAGAEEDAA